MNQKRFNEYLIILAGILLSAYYELPAFVSAIRGIGHIFILACVVFLVYIFNRNCIIKKVDLLLAISFALELFFYIIFGNKFNIGTSYLIQDTIIRYADIVVICIFLGAVNKISEHSRKILWTISILFLVFTSAITLVYLQIEPEVVRNLVTETSNEYNSGIANYNIVYGAILTISPIILKIRQSHHSEKIFLTAVMLLLVLFIFDCAFSIAILVLICEFLFIFYYVSSKNKIRKAVICILIGLLSTLVILNIQFILTLLYNSVDSPSFQVRIKEVQMFFLTGQKGGDLLGRIGVYSKSLTTITKSWFMGYPFTLHKNALDTIVGGHSRILDYCAELGIIPLVLYLIWLWHKVMDYFPRKDTDARNYGKVVFILMVMLMTLNPMYEGYLLYYGLFYLILAKNI